jgi:hypothetical protein
VNPVSWGELAVAGATLILAGVTGFMAWKTSQSVAAMKLDADSSQRAAEATERSAKAAEEGIAEIQRSRELEWRPHLSMAPPIILAAADSFVMRVTNVGRGPALRCVCGVWANERALFSGAFDLPAGESRKVMGDRLGVGAFSNLREMFMVKGELPVAQREIAFCRDWLTGSWYRFLRLKVAPDTWDGVVMPAPSWVLLLQTAVPLQPEGA